ncbi:MAG: hypothetical protein M1826_005366 [Phylliscum demangeonii]|nr:MAG: hypothetical protein M1826_005366 [Phylliscum demangeonii]
MSFLSPKWVTDPASASLLDYNPFDILGLNPRDPDFPNDKELRAAYDRAIAHTHPFATSSTLTLPAPLQVQLAYSTLISFLRIPALAFWRPHHRSTWNPHAPVGSVAAGLPIPGQSSGPGPAEAAVLKAAAVAAVEANEHDYSLALLNRYIPPPVRRPDDGLALAAADQGYRGLAYDYGYRRLAGDYGGLLKVVLGTFRASTEKGARANVVVGVLDRCGRYYRRVLDFTMEDERLPGWTWRDRYRFPGWEHYFAFSCPPAAIDYLPRFRDRAEREVVAMVRQELARLHQAERERETHGA